MIEIIISEEQIKRAKELYDFNKLKNSFTKGESQIYGALGEIVFIDYYSIDKNAHVGAKDYDFFYRNSKVEIKTKKTSIQPLPYYLCSIPMTSAHQECDQYVFIRILNDMSKAWICGWITKSKFFTDGFYGKKDTLDPTSDNNFLFKEDCMNLPISSLKTNYSGNLGKTFIEKYFKIREEEPFILTDYKPYKEKNGSELQLRAIYDFKNNKLTVQDLNKGNLFDGYVKTQKQFIYLFEHLLEIVL